ncbi:serine-rich adhesin for platelets [Magallana gigas]|uniref:serine-rich adhesin for platelets n=1 Tax=Magallana gigas TaxID=29159 RepID=UPI00333FA3B3
MLWSLIGDRIQQTCFGIMGRCPRNVNDWLRALVIVTIYNFVHGLASPTEVLKSSMQYLSTNQTGPSSNPTTYPRTSNVSLQYIQSSSEVFTRLEETTGDWYGISSSKYTSDPEFSQNQEYSDIVVLLEKPPSATEITSLVNAVDKQTPSSNYDQIWTSSSALVRGSLAEGQNKNDTTLGSSDPRTNNSNSRMDSIPKLNSMSTQLSNINSVISSSRLDTKLAPTKSSKASLLPHPNVSSLQENQDMAEMSHSSYSTSESFKSYSNKETLSYSLQTSFSGIDHSFSSVDKFVGDQTLYPSSLIFSSDLLLNEILSPIPAPISNTFPSAPMESLVVIEWPTSVHKETVTKLFSSRKKSSAKDSSSKTQGNFNSTAHASDHTVFPKPKISTEHALPFKVSSMNTSKHSLTESHNSSLPYGLQQSFNTETYVLLTENHRTTVPIQVIKSNKGGSGNIAENEITSTNYKSASSISTTYLEFYTAYYVEDSSYDKHLLQPSETTILGLSDVLDSSKSTETIPTTAHFHSTGESDRLAYSPFEKEETESTSTGRELSWSDTYSNNIFSNVINSDTMTALPNKQIQTSAIMSSSVQTHRIIPTSTHKEENTTKAVERALHSSFDTEFKTSSIDALEPSLKMKESKATTNLYSTNSDFPSDTNDQYKTSSEVKVSKTLINLLTADTGYLKSTTYKSKSSTQLGASKTIINPFSTGFQTSRIEKLKSSSQETMTVTNLSPTNTKSQTNTIDQLQSSSQVEESTSRESLFTFDFQTSKKDKLKSSSLETELKSMNVRFSTDTVFQTNTFDQLRSSGDHFTTEFNTNEIETPTFSHESITKANLFSTDLLPQTNTLALLKSVKQMEESKAKKHGFTTDFQTDMIEKIKSSLRERESLSNNIMNPLSTETELKTNSIDVVQSSIQVKESRILENHFSSKSEFQVNQIKSSLDVRKPNTTESHFSSTTEVLRTNTWKTSSKVGERKTDYTPGDQLLTPLYFYDEFNATPINTVMFQSVHVGTSEQIVSPVKQTIHSSVTLSFYSSILQDLQSSYNSDPGDGDHWTTTKEPLHISTDNSAELLSALSASEEAIDAQSKQTGEQMSSVFSKTLVKTMSSQLASSADYNLLSSFKENKLSSETHAIYAYQSKLPTTVDDLLSTASATSNATTTKPSALIHSSFGDLVGYSLHSTIGGYFSSGVLNSTVIKLTVPTMESSVNYDKTSSNFTSEETPLNTKMSRFANRRGVENRTVKPLDTTDYSIMSSVNYNNAEIASQSILSSMPMYANTQIQNLSHAETLPAQSSIETKYMYQVTSDLRTTYNNLLSSYPIYVPTISASFSSVHSHLIDDAVRTMSQVVMSVAGSNVQSQVNTDHTSCSSVIATNADLSVKVQEESDVFDRESSGVYFSSLYSSDRPLLEVSFSRGVTPFETKYVGSSMIKDMLGTHEIAVTNAMIEQTTFTPEILQTPSLTVMFDSDTIGLSNDKSLKDNQMLSAIPSKRSEWVSESIHLQQKHTSDHSEIQSSISESAFLPTISYNWNLYASTIKTIATISTSDHIRLESSVKGSSDTTISTLDHIGLDSSMKSSSDTTISTSEHIRLESSVKDSSDTMILTSEHFRMDSSVKDSSDTTISISEHFRMDSSVKDSSDTTFSTSEHFRLDSSMKWSSVTTISTSEHIRMDSSVKDSSDTTISISEHFIMDSSVKDSIETTISTSEHFRLDSSMKWSSDSTMSTSEHITLDSSMKLSSDSTISTSEHIRFDSSVKWSSDTGSTESSGVSLKAKPTLPPTVSTVAVTSPSITVYPYPENNLLVIEIDVKLGIDISQEHFKEKLEEGLTTIYVEGMSQRRRRSSSKTRTKDTGIFVKIKDIKRKSGERVEIIFLVTYNGIVVSASLAEMAFQKMSDIKMSAILGYPVVVPVSRLTSRKEPPSDDSWWGGLFNPLVITLIAVPTSIVVIATVIAIVYQCRSKSIQRYPSVPSQMDSLYKHNLVVDVENGDVRNRRIFYDYPSDDEFSMTSSEAFNEIKHKYSQSMHSKIRNFEKLNTKNHFYNQLEKKPSDVVRNKVTFGLDGDDNKCQCTKTDSNESNDSGVIVDAPKSPAHEQNNLKLDVPSVKTTHIVQSQNDSQAAPKSVILQNPYPVKKKSNLVNLSGERVTSWVFMGENTNSANECIPESCDSKQIMTASDSVNRIAHDSNYIPPQHGVECQASDQGALPGVQDHFYETLNRKEPSNCDHSTGTQTQSGLSGSDGFEYLEPLRQLLLAVEQQRRRVPPVDQFLNDESVFKQSFQGMCNLEHRPPISPSVKSPSLPLRNTTDGYNCESDNNCESDSKNESDVCSIGSDKRTQNETHERKERQLAKGIDTKCEEISRADSCTYDQPFLYPVGFAHTAEI